MYGIFVDMSTPKWTKIRSCEIQLSDGGEDANIVVLNCDAWVDTMIFEIQTDLSPFST
jgi:hypothetical protein